MSSFNVVNYSLRPNKAIQRGIVFDGARELWHAIGADGFVYVGFGSVWFTDFTLAHRELQIRDMISIESDDIGFRRAVFNKPFKTVRVEEGISTTVLPKLLSDTTINTRPWFIWLDYDRSLEETTVDDARLVIEGAPQNSIFLLTVNASAGSIASKPNGRPQRLKSLLGSVVPDELSRDDCQDQRIQGTLLDLLKAFMVSAAVDVARPGGFIPTFGMAYKDGAPMVTVGGVLPSRGGVPAVRQLINSPNWGGFPPLPIITPHLTLREAAVLQSELPRTRSLSRKQVQRLGFDLEEEQIKSFEKYYMYYPAFAQITT